MCRGGSRGVAYVAICPWWIFKYKIIGNTSTISPWKLINTKCLFTTTSIVVKTFPCFSSDLSLKKQIFVYKIIWNTSSYHQVKSSIQNVYFIDLLYPFVIMVGASPQVSKHPHLRLIADSIILPKEKSLSITQMV